ncbi:cupin domain-containing protein [Lyngbya confervoides]|uniref:Cupin domain-containing protein n=1 Tax=Lyngbya confervoides BDU141951 TaxID=1574623 RepID=A0ABD4T7W3_9CYAN|nr:cupin domain-containing protein [Lyngbya confervoides]MCM1984641.1 cupin domain-containing protein [Lyngbya confervoides BDU141951]
MNQADTYLINEKDTAEGSQGQKYLASGQEIALRLWKEESADTDKPQASRNYETVGYVISGQAELTLAGQTLALNPGDSWYIPKGSAHRYRILESLTAIEATHPPARQDP